LRDRLDASFGDPGDDKELGQAQHNAWETYAAGRGLRLGYSAYDDRQVGVLYQFRIRHGFSDVGDAAFDKLWTATASRGPTSRRCPTNAAAAVPP